MRELIDKRTLTAKSWDLQNGFRRLEAHIGQIHFQDGAAKDGAFSEIDTTLEYNASSKLFAMTKTSYEAEIGLYGDVRFYNVDHSLQFQLPNPNRVEAASYDGSAFGRLQKALIWRDILQPGGHQIVEARNNSLAKIFRFDEKPISNIIEFQAIASAGVKFSDGISDFDLTKEASRSIKGRQGLFHSNGRLSWIRQPRAWNHRGEVVDVELQFFRRGNQVWLRKIIPQGFIDRTFAESGAWLETDTTTSFYAGAGDGLYRRQLNESTFSAIRSGAQTASDTTSTYGNAARLAADALEPTYVIMERSCFPVDTSGLPDDATFPSATFYAYGQSEANSLGGTVALSLDHYITAGYAIGNYSGVRQASDIAYANFSIVGYNSFALNAAGLANINKTGTTQLALRLSQDLDNSEPSWVDSTENKFAVYFSEYGNTDHDPYLEVVYIQEFVVWNRNRNSNPHYRM